MGLLFGLGLIGAAFAMDIPKNVKVSRQNDIMKKYQHQECQWHIDYVKHHGCDDEGNRVSDYCYEHSYYDEVTQKYHNCFNDEAVYFLAKRQCERHGVAFGMTEALFSCPAPQVKRFFTDLGLYKQA